MQIIFQLVVSLVAPRVCTPTHTHEAESRHRQASISRPHLTHRPIESRVANRPSSTQSISSHPLGVSLSEFRKRKETECRENLVQKEKRKPHYRKKQTSQSVFNIDFMLCLHLIISVFAATSLFTTTFDCSNIFICSNVFICLFWDPLLGSV